MPATCMRSDTFTSDFIVYVLIYTGIAVGVAVVGVIILLLIALIIVLVVKLSKNNIGTQPEKDDQLFEKIVEKDKPV